MPTRGRRPSLAALAVALLVLAASPRAHSPHDVVYGLELSPTFAVDQTIFAAVTLSEHDVLARSTDGGRSWTTLGIGPMLHDYQTMSFSDDFASDGTCFIATTNGGVWRTTDAGDSWQRVTGALPSQLCRDVAVSPNFSVDQTVLTSTTAGLYRSTDGGDTWTLVTDGVAGSVIALLHTVPGTAGTMFCGRDELFRSLDSGATWQQLGTFASPISEIATSPNFAVDQSMVLCFGRYGGGILSSVDGGSTFTPMNDGVADEFVNSVDIADDGTLYACTQIDPCYRAPAIGGTWSAFDEGFEVLSDLTPDHYKVIRRMPGGDRVIVAGFEGIFVSEDDGVTFTQRNIYPVSILRAIAMSPNYLNDGKAFVGSYGGGVYALGERSFTVDSQPTRPRGKGLAGSTTSETAPLTPSTPGATPPAPQLPDTRRWSSAAGGLESLFSTTMQLSPDYSPSSPTLFYSYQGVWRSTDDGATWAEVPTPEEVTVIRGLGLAPDYPADPTLVIGTNSGVGTWLSTDDGASWTEFTDLPNVHTTRAIRFSPFFASDQTFFLSLKDQGIFRTLDGGTTFTNVTFGLFSDPVLRAFEMSPTYAADSTLFVGTRGDGLWRSTDAGDTWQQVTAGLPAPEDLSVESIAISPRFALDSTMFIATLANEVFKSTDGGTTWTSSSAGLPATACWVIDVSPNFPADPRLLLSTNDWIYESKDAGATWTQMPTYARVDDLYNEIRYDGFWTNEVFPGNLSFGTRTSDTPGSTSTFEFLGSEISWFGVLNPDGGIASIEIDGELVATIDTYAPTQQTGTLLFSQGFDGPGFHEIVITVDGTSNPSSSGVVIQTDGFAYRFEDTP